MARDKEVQAQMAYHFLQHLDRSGFDNVSYLRQQFNDFKETIEEAAKLEPLSASTLSHRKALTIFNLGNSQSWVTWHSEQDELYDVSDSVIQYLNKIDNVSHGDNEVRARMKVDAIRIESIFEEKRFALGVHNHNHRSSNGPIPATSGPGTLLGAKPDGHPVPAPLILKPEVEIHRIVTYKYERRLLKGIADYTLHYDEKDPYGMNLVIIEAKQYGAAGLAEGQLLAYMGMVHQARKDQGKQDITVFGIASDGEAFRYYRIDNESQLVRSPHFDWAVPQHQKEIISRLRLIIRAAIGASPSRTPIKKGQLREAMLTRFDDPVAKGRFDFNTCETDWGSSSEDIEIIGDT